VRISSAGTSALEGQPASVNAVEAAARHDIDITDHRSRLLNATMVRRADLILTMGRKHLETVGVIEPAALSYGFRLGEFGGSGGDIADPIGAGMEGYSLTFDMIHECIEGLARALEDPGFDGWRGGAGTGRTP
jgi:protein-tyrosine phosphatase